MQLNTVNKSQNVYLTRCGQGELSVGFDVMHRRACAVANWIGLPEPSAMHGSESHFRQCADLMQKGYIHASRTRKSCSGNLSVQLTGLEGQRVRVEDEQGKCRVFLIALSTGWMPVHLEVSKGNREGVPAAFRYRSVTVVH